MEWPYFLVLEATVGAGGTATVSYPVPVNEELKILGLRQVSTGDFNITDIRTSDGVHYTNATAAVEIPGSYFADLVDNYNGLRDFPVPLDIVGGSIFYVDLENASASSNTITLIFHCVRSTG